MSDCDRFLEVLASDRLDEGARARAASCPVCGPLLPRETPPDVGSAAALEAVRTRALEALRATPLRPWSATRPGSRCSRQRLPWSSG